MFKGLKSKIAEETKKIQNEVVSRMSESLASGGSQSSDRVRQNEGEDQVPPMTGPGSRNLRSGSQDVGNLIDIESDIPQQNSAFMQSSDECDLTRSDSINSLNSIGSGVNLFQNVPQFNANRLSAIPDTDTESIADSTVGSTVLNSASKEQISSVLHKLQGRAANYKDKYRELARGYKDLLRDNEKCRSVLTTTQDKALRRIEQLREEKQLLNKQLQQREHALTIKLDTQDNYIVMLRKQIELGRDGETMDFEVLDNAKPVGANNAKELVGEREKVRKLEELLTRCKESIRNNKEKVMATNVESERLKNQINQLTNEVGNAGMGELANERIVEEWKLKLEHAEKSWAAKLADADERSCIAVAEAKKDMHDELNVKDNQLQSIRTRLHQIELAATEEQGQLQRSLAEARETIDELDIEKKELLEKMSKNKVQVVNLVKEEEEKKRGELQFEWEEKSKQTNCEWQGKIEEIHEMYKNKMQEKEGNWSAKMKEVEEQMQLAIEEREMQKNAAVMQQDSKLDSVNCRVEQLNTDKLELASSIKKYTEEIDSLKTKMQEMIEQQKNALLEKENKIKDLERAQTQGMGEMGDLIEKERSEKVNLETSLKESEAIIKNNKEKLQGIENKLQETQTNLQETQSRFEDLQAEKSTLLTNLENSNKTEQDLNSKLQEAETKCLEITKKFENSVTEVENLKSKMKDKIQDVDILVGDLTKLEQENKDTVEKLNKSIEVYKIELDEKSRSINSLREELSLKEGEFASRITELSHDKKAADEFEKQLVKVKEDEIRRREEIGQEMKNEFEKQKIEIEAVLNEKERQINKLGEGMKKSEEQLTELRSTLNEKMTAFSDLETFNKTLISDFEEEKSAKIALEENLKMLNEEISLTKSTINEKNASITQLETDISLIKNTVVEKDSSITQLQKDVESVTLNYQFAVKERDIQIEELRDLMGGLEDAVHVYRKEWGSQKVKEKELESKMKEAKQENYFKLTESESQKCEFADRVGELEDAIEIYKKQSSQRQDKVIELTEQNKGSGQELKDVRIRMENVMRDSFFALKEREQDLSRTQERVNELEDAVEMYKIQMTDVNKGKKEQKVQLESLKSDLDKSRAQLQNAIDQKMQLESRENPSAKIVKELTELAERNHAIMKNLQNDVTNDSHANIDRPLAEFSDNLIEMLRIESDAIRHLKQEMAENNSHLETKTQGLEVLNAEKETLRKQVQDIECNNTELKNVNENLKTQLGKEREEKINLDESKKQIEQEKIVLVQSQQMQSNKGNSEKEQILRELDLKNTKIKELESEITGLKSELEPIKTNLATKTSDLDAQKIILESLKTEKDDLSLQLKQSYEKIEEENKRLMHESDEKCGDVKKKLQVKMTQIKKQLVEEHEKKENEFKAQIILLESKGSNDSESANKELMNMKEEFDQVKQAMQHKEHLLKTENEKVLSLEANLHEARLNCELLETNCERMQGAINELQVQINESNANIEKLKSEHEIELTKLTGENETSNEDEENKKASQDTLITKLERQVQEYKKEMKKMYADLNDQGLKQEELRRFYEEQLKSKDDELSDAHKERVNAIEMKENELREHLNNNSAEGMISTLQDRVQSLESELKRVNETHFKEMSMLATGLIDSGSGVNMQQMSPSHNSAPYGNNNFHAESSEAALLHPISLGHFPASPLFSDPNEAEYLRNVLFRYMVERESLGKESVTLARVIATVLKFTADQTNTVVHKEESRLPTWMRRNSNKQKQRHQASKTIQKVDLDLEDSASGENEHGGNTIN